MYSGLGQKPPGQKKSGISPLYKIPADKKPPNNEK